MELTNEDLMNMKIKMGPRKTILKLIREMKDKSNAPDKISVQNYEVEADGSLTHKNTTIPETASTTQDRGQNIATHPSYADSTIEHNVNQPRYVPKPSVDSFSRYVTVNETLVKHIQGKAVMSAATAAFTEPDRRALIRILVAELVKVHDSYYPPEPAKIALAKAIVKEFPLLKDQKSNTGCEHYYDVISKRGFIEYRLWTIRKNLSPSKKKYQGTTSKLTSAKVNKAILFDKLIPEEELNEKISWMKCKNPSESNKLSIMTCLNETFANRRDWIQNNNPTISDVFNTYPRLLDYKGEMIDQEFEKMYEGLENKFLASYSINYTKKILSYAASHRPDVSKIASSLKNENLRALMILAELLPVTNTSTVIGRGQSKSSGRMKGRKKQRVDENNTAESQEMEKRSVGIPNKFLIQIAPQ